MHFRIVYLQGYMTCSTIFKGKPVVYTYLIQHYIAVFENVIFSAMCNCAHVIILKLGGRVLIVFFENFKIEHFYLVGKF